MKRTYAFSLTAAVVTAAVYYYNTRQSDDDDERSNHSHREVSSALPPPSTSSSLPGTIRTKETRISAPGKVLVAGGYAVLQRPNVGVVLSTTSRFYTTVCLRNIDKTIAKSFKSPIKRRPSLSPSNSTVSPEKYTPLQGNEIGIRVVSKQFRSVYHYILTYDPLNESLPTLLVTSSSIQDSQDNRKYANNTYIETTLICAFSYVQSSMGSDQFRSLRGSFVNIDLEADNDFYSQINYLKKQGLPVTYSNLQKVPRFNPCERNPSGGVNKTGMGSSAALITSLVGGILDFCCVDSSSWSDFTKIVHNTAQCCHSYAQGKIGSGFDVSAACYSSHVYTRFSPTIISDLINKVTTEKGGLPSPKDLYDCVHSEAWDQTMKSIKLFGACRLITGDVCGGSDTPSMARKVLKWQKENEIRSSVDQAGKIGAGAATLWERLIDANNSVTKTISDLCVLGDKPGAEELFSDLATLTFGQWEKLCGDDGEDCIASSLCSLRAHFMKARKILKEIGTLAEVPIEPDEQTALCDGTMELPGVIACGVPGAGGYDAVFALCIGDEAVSKVAAYWEGYQRVSVCPLLGQIESGEGIRCESLVK